VALDNQAKLDEAIAAYHKAIGLDPKYAAPRNNLGVTLHKKGLLDEAVTWYRKAIELDPKHVRAENNLAVALNELAWGLATNPNPKLRASAKAVALAEEAVRIA